jgi:hypothetical protein
MKRIIIGLFLFFFVQQTIYAQIKAVTETGDEVLLNDDGTWKYTDNIILEETVIPVNEKKFVKDQSATFLVKSTKLNVGVWINPKTWSFEKASEEKEYEFEFKKKGGELQALLLCEKTYIPLQTLKFAAFENAKSVAPDIKIVKEEYRDVNGIRVLCLHLAGTIKGIRFNYFGYYYSCTKGSVQFITYTGESLFQEYMSEIEAFINGFVELN